MTSNKQQKGVIDPISIIAGLFLVVTLIVGTVVVNDRGFSLNIAEKASTTGNSCFDECRKEKGRVYCNNLCGINVNWEGEVITAPVNPSAGVTCDANGKQYSAGSVVIYGGIGSYATCGSDGRWQVGVGSLTDVKPENVPQYALPAYQQAVNQAQQPNAEVNQQETTTLASDELRRDCEFSGGVWNNTNSSCFNPNLQEVVNEFHEIQDTRPLDEKRCSGTSYIETWNGTTWDRSRCEYGCLNNACIANNPNTIIKPDEITEFNQPNTAEGSTTPTEIVNETGQEITQSFLNSLLQQIPGWDNYQGIGLGYQTNSQTGSSQPTTNNSFFTNFASKWSQSFGEGSMFDSDGYTFNLGGNAGSFAISPPPPSVMFSENPKDLEDYYMGSLISGGAGATFAAAGIFATAPTFFITQAMTVPGVVQVLTVADALDSTATGVACKLGNEDACSYFAASVAIPGFTSQNMLIDTFDDFAQAWSGVGTTINRNADSIIEAVIPSNYYNNISLGNTETAIDTASDMLFAPNYANQLPINITETGEALNVNSVVDSLITNSPGFQTSQVDNIQTWNQSTVVVDNNFHNLPDDIFVNNPNIFIEDNFFPYSVGDQISINPFADISVPMLDTSSLVNQADDLLQAMVPTNFSGITTGPNVIDVTGNVPQATEIDINNLPDPEDLPEILGLISPDGVLLPNLRYNITEVDMELPSTKNLTFVTPDGDNLIISVSHGGYGSSIGIKTNIPVKIDGKPFGGGPRTTVSMDKDTSIEIYPGTFLKWDGHGYEPGFTVTTYDSKNFLSVITDNIPTSLRITMFDPRKIRLEQQYKIAIDSMVGFKSGDYNLTDFDQINEAYRLAGLSEETMYRIQSEVDKQWLPDFLPTKETWLSLLHKSNFAEPFLPNSPATVDAIPVFKVTKPADSAKLKAVSESPSLITLNQKVDDPIINSLEQRIDEAAELVSQGRYDEAEKLLLDETFLEEIGIDILTTRAGMSQSDIDQLLDIDDYTFYRIADTFRSPVAGRIEIGEFFDITTKENISFPPFVEKERVSLLIEEFYHRLQDFKEAIINPGYYDTTSMQNGLGGLREMEVSIFLNGHGIPLSDAHLSSYDSRNNIGLPIHNYEVNPPENTIIPTDGFLPPIKNWWDDSPINWQNWGLSGSPANNPFLDESSNPISTSELLNRGKGVDEYIETYLPQYSGIKPYVDYQNVFKGEIPTDKVVAINSDSYKLTGGQGLSVEEFRRILKNGEFNEYLYWNDPVTGWRFPDGSVYIEFGRHKAIAFIEEGYTDIPMKVYDYKFDKPNSQHGQVSTVFSSILPVTIAMPAAGLYFADQYFDLGIVDAMTSSINEALEPTQNKSSNITDPVYNTVNFWANTASVIYAINNDKELSEIAINNPDQRPYDEIIQEAIDNYTANNPGSDIYYSPNPNALSLTDIFKQTFNKDSLEIISTTLADEEFKKLSLSGKIMKLSNNLLTDRNTFIDSVVGAAGNIGLFTKDGGTYPIIGFENEVVNLTAIIESEVENTGNPVSHSFVIEYFLDKNNGDLSQAILDSSNFEEFLTRSLDGEIVDDPYVWIQNHILDEYSPILPYHVLSTNEEVLENSQIYYDYSLPNRLGQVYHAANISALLNYLPPEVIRAMVIGEYLSYGEKHGLIKMSADLEILKRLDQINDLLKSYEQPTN